MGFSEAALVSLRDVAEGEAQRPATRANCALVLAEWHGARGEFAEALRWMVARRQISPKFEGERRQLLLEGQFLARLGRGSEAAASIEHSRSRNGRDMARQLLLADCDYPEPDAAMPAASAGVWARLNAIFREHGLAELAPRDEAAALSIGNLCGLDIQPVHNEDVRVSVIVPAFNAAATIGIALQSLVEQSWTNLDVIVVDDCSTDDTVAIAESFAHADARFRVLRQQVNAGSYAARNAGLAVASGRFVTTLDADDWAHPDRIRVHAEDLLRSGRVYNLSHWARVQANLYFSGVWKPRPELTHLNLGSLFLATETAKKLGGWAEGRVSSDREFIRRVEMVCGDRNRVALAERCPLTFGRVDGGSLTQVKETSTATALHGVRREYHEWTDFWHGELLKRGDFESAVEAVVHIAATTPRPIRPERSGAELDLLVIADWNMKGGAFHSSMNMVVAGRRAGLRVGIFNYRRMDMHLERPLPRTLRRFAFDNDVTVVAAGETLRTRDVVVAYPAVLDQKLDRFPVLAFERLIVVINQLAERNVTGTDSAYNLDRAKANLVEYFGTVGDWVPISERVRSIMEADARYPRPHADTWTPMLDAEAWLERDARWRGRERKRPVLGRHGRDHHLKWPKSRENLLAAYCANRPCDTQFLGGADYARQVLGRGWPRNWQVKAFGSEDVRTFLAGLDIFLHYPDEDYIEEFGRAPMEAMAAGVPVILPPVFRETFGDAAIYAKPQDVWAEVARLWASEARWTERVAVGRAFVRSHCRYELFPRRLGLAATQAVEARAAEAVD